LGFGSVRMGSEAAWGAWERGSVSALVLTCIIQFGGYEPRGCTRSPYIVRIIRKAKTRLGGDFFKVFLTETERRNFWIFEF
jgi:hypothetical protein